MIGLIVIMVGPLKCTGNISPYIAAFHLTSLHKTKSIYKLIT